MKDYYFCDELEWEGLVDCRDTRQALRHIQIIGFSLRQQLEKELLNSCADSGKQEFINVDHSRPTATPLGPGGFDFNAVTVSFYSF